MPMRYPVVLELKRCRGCTACTKCCPTEAIRVRGRKATTLSDRCTDCGSCIHICPRKTIGSVSDSLDILKQCQYCVVPPKPALYGQFQHPDSVDTVPNGLLEIGFHKVYEVAKAAEMIFDFEQQSIGDGSSKVTPQISSPCPTVLRLVRTRFPEFMDHVACIILPIELAAILVRREVAERTDLSPEAIGIFAIMPCPSRVTVTRVSEGFSRSVLDGTFVIRDVYLRLLDPVQELEEITPIASTGILGLGWTSHGGKSAVCLGEHCMAAGGIRNVIRMLEEIEDSCLPEADLLELPARTQGCVGGCFNVKNPYAAKLRIKGLLKGLSVSRNRSLFHGETRDIVRKDKELQYLPVFVLDQDREMAINKQSRIRKLESHPPDLHCGSCEAPSYRAFAGDVVLGRAPEGDCIFKARERMRSTAGGKEKTDDYLSLPFRRRQEPSEQTLRPP